MTEKHPLDASLVAAWRTNNRVTIGLIEHLPPALWGMRIPGMSRRTVRMLAAHLHNARCRWIKTLGREHGIAAPERVDHHHATRRQVVTALKRSGRAMEALLRLGLTSGGAIPPSRGYVWRNMSLDVGHFLTYFVAHEAHHRGQVVMVARQSGQRLPESVTAKLWWWRMEGAKKAR